MCPGAVHPGRAAPSRATACLRDDLRHGIGGLLRDAVVGDVVRPAHADGTDDLAVGRHDRHAAGGEYEIKDGETVLDVLLAGGVDAPYSCRQGICGDCIVRVLAGEPDHRDDVLTDRERADGMFTTCSSQALSPILELDL